MEVRVPRINEKSAVDFLLKGFQQSGVKPNEDVLNLAVKELGGIMGWLTLFGSESVEENRCTKETLARTVKKGSRMAAKEFENFLKVREQARKRYIQIIKSAVRLRDARWTDLKRDLELKEGKRIPNNIFTDLVDNLVKGGFLDKGEDGTYSIPDPLLAYSVRSGFVR